MRISVQGGRELRGTAELLGAKNSVLPIMAASILVKDKVKIKKTPDLSDVTAAQGIFNSVGGKAVRDINTMTLDAGNVNSFVLPDLYTSVMRSGIFFVAPILSRMGKVYFGLPGGCKLGTRPIDIHLEGLRALGATIEHDNDHVCCSAKNGLIGTHFKLRLPSVGATETMIIAAVLAKGETVLYNVAKEPEIKDLSNFLNACGADIQGFGSETIIINGVRELHGCEYTPFSDRIVLSTLICAVAGTGGEIHIKGGNIPNSKDIVDLMRKSGVYIEQNSEHVTVKANLSEIKGMGKVQTLPYPGFATDSAPLLGAAMLKASGESEIEDRIFQNRYACAKGFLDLGGNVQVVGNVLKIKPVENLHGARLNATDLRGGAALVIAALSSQGESIIDNVSHIARGYDNIVAMFSNLNARIKYIE